MKMLNLLTTILSRGLFVIFLIVYAIPLLIYLLMPEKIRYGSRWVSWIPYVFYWMTLKLSLLDISFEGLENLPKGPAIFAANHQSSFDIPLLGVLARGAPHIWLARSELLDSWLFRFTMPRGAIMIDVNFPLKAMRSLVRAINMVRDQDVDLMIFPEGGRYTDGTIHEFFGGFVILAKKSGRPVVPVYIEGVDKVYPPDSFIIQRHPIRVVIGKPFVYKEGQEESAFRAQVYQWFIEQSGN